MNSRRLVVLALLLLVAAVFYTLGSNRRVQVPDIAGLDQAQAIREASARNLNFQQELVYSEDRPAGLVVGQVPASGAWVPPGSTIFVKVSRGLERVSVPNFQHLSLAQAMEMAGRHDVVLRVERTADRKVPAGTIGTQNPPPEAAVPPQSPVLVTVGGGPSRGGTGREVPELQGQTEKAAVKLLASSGLKLEVVRRDPSAQIPEGGVISQEPVAGTQVSGGAPVRVVVSQGKDLKTAPNLVGKTVSEAQDIAIPLGLHLEVGGAAADDAQITSQDPTPGAPLSQPRMQVTAQATEAVPNLIGKTEADAVSALERSGLTAGPVTRTASDAPSGTVIDQDPPAGIETLKGTPIRITLSQ